jgi:hypothetical protein
VAPSGSVFARIRRAWGFLPPERRLAAVGALGLLLTLFLPWYQETVIARGRSANLNSLSASLTGWGAFSWVEAAVLLVAVAVLVLLFVRAEGKAFHVPWGDGGVITGAGAWTCLLIVWRMFDKQGTTGHGLYETTSGIEWGIFVALAVAALLTYAGSRIRRAHEPEPPLPGERPASAPPRPQRARPPQPVAAVAGVAPAVPARKRVRPSSVAAPPPARPDGRRAPRPATDRAEQPEKPTRRMRPSRRPHRGLDFEELETIKFDEPPEPPARFRRPSPSEDE